MCVCLLSDVYPWGVCMHGIRIVWGVYMALCLLGRVYIGAYVVYIGICLSGVLAVSAIRVHGNTVA